MQRTKSSHSRRSELFKLLPEDLHDDPKSARKRHEPARWLARSSSLDRSTTQRAVLTMLEMHVAEHTGQAIAYARMNGIVPPWSN